MWAAGFYSPARLGETACILALGIFPSLPTFSLVNTDSSLAYSTLLMYTLYFRVCRMALAELQLKCCHSLPFQASSAAGEVMFEPRITLMRAGVHIHTHVHGLSCIYVGLSVYQCALFCSSVHTLNNVARGGGMCLHCRTWRVDFYRRQSSYMKS